MAAPETEKALAGQREGLFCYHIPMPDYNRFTPYPLFTTTGRDLAIMRRAELYQSLPETERYLQQAARDILRSHTVPRRYMTTGRRMYAHALSFRWIDRLRQLDRGQVDRVIRGWYRAHREDVDAAWPMDLLDYLHDLWHACDFHGSRQFNDGLFAVAAWALYRMEVGDSITLGLPRPWWALRVRKRALEELRRDARRGKVMVMAS